MVLNRKLSIARPLAESLLSPTAGQALPDVFVARRYGYSRSMRRVHTIVIPLSGVEFQEAGIDIRWWRIVIVRKIDFVFNPETRHESLER